MGEESKYFSKASAEIRSLIMSLIKPTAATSSFAIYVRIRLTILLFFEASALCRGVCPSKLT